MRNGWLVLAAVLAATACGSESKGGEGGAGGTGGSGGAGGDGGTTGPQVDFWSLSIGEAQPFRITETRVVDGNLVHATLEDAGLVPRPNVEVRLDGEGIDLVHVRLASADGARVVVDDDFRVVGQMVSFQPQVDLWAEMPWRLTVSPAGEGSFRWKGEAVNEVTLCFKTRADNSFYMSKSFDRFPPAISSVQVDPASVGADEDVRVSVGATDLTPMLGAGAVIAPEAEGAEGFPLELAYDPTTCLWTGSTRLPAQVPGGTWHVAKATATALAGYPTTEELEASGDHFAAGPFAVPVPRFEVQDRQSESDAPAITAVRATVERRSVHLAIEATDAGAGLGEAEATLRGPTGAEEPLPLTAGESGWSGTREFLPWEDGTWTVSKIRAADRARNELRLEATGGAHYEANGSATSLQLASFELAGGTPDTTAPALDRVIRVFDGEEIVAPTYGLILVRPVEEGSGIASVTGVLATDCADPATHETLTFERYDELSWDVLLFFFSRTEDLRYTLCSIEAKDRAGNQSTWTAGETGVYGGTNVPVATVDVKAGREPGPTTIASLHIPAAAPFGGAIKMSAVLDDPSGLLYNVRATVRRAGDPGGEMPIEAQFIQAYDTVIPNNPGSTWYAQLQLLARYETGEWLLERLEVSQFDGTTVVYEADLEAGTYRRVDEDGLSEASALPVGRFEVR